MRITTIILLAAIVIPTAAGHRYGGTRLHKIRTRTPIVMTGAHR